MDTAIISSAGAVDDDGALQLWASGVGLGREVERLTAARRGLGAVLAGAQGKEDIQNKALLLHLREAAQMASRAGDLLGELDHYRIHWETTEHHRGGKLLPDIGDKNLPRSTPRSDIKFLNNGRAEGAEDTAESSFSNEDSSPPALQVVPNKDISREISEHVEECCRIAKYLHNALELENLDCHIARRNPSTRTDPRETSPCHTEPKVYGRDQERDFIISKLTSSIQGDALA